MYDEKQIEKNIGLCVYVMRKENKMSAKKLGELLEKSECAITAWERGEKNPSLNSVIKLCNVFECTIDEFFESYKRLKTDISGEEVQKPDVKARNEEIFKKRKEGMTMRKLSDEYNLSIERIYMICQKEQDEFNRRNDSLWQLLCVNNKKEISLRVYNCLRRNGIHTEESLQSVIDDLISGKLQFSNFGKGCRSYLADVKKSA